ncbi:MAG: DUF1553 domain-containing protein [Fuerstiella sp.]
MTSPSVLFRTICTALIMNFGLSANAGQDAAVDYETDVKPILRTHCFDCHGPDTQESGLRLDRRQSLLRGGDSGEPAVVPGSAERSHLVELITGKDPDRLMPPESERLSDKQIAVVSSWINGGLQMPADASEEEKLTTDHWSFQPVQSPVVPSVNDNFVRTPIDAFILSKLRQQQLRPSSRADIRTLIRRMFLVMHGLPPTAAQMNRWSAKLTASPAFEETWAELVEEVLASPRYGERWARHWLDIVRFGETHGFETNRERPNAWHYRDYVIRAFNDDLPYDQFVREQIAGDALGADVATGFLVAGPHDLVKSPDKNLTLMQRQDELSDLINVTGTTFLGLTLGCARCHNHKFDPVSQRDFYAVQAVFAGVQHGDRKLPVSDARQEQLAAVEMRITELRRRLAEFIPIASTADHEFPEPDRAASGTASESAGESNTVTPNLMPRRPPVNASRNIERLMPTRARFVRFTVLQTNSSEPCIDELEVLDGDRNIALADHGTRATSSGNLPGYEIHQLKHVHDGRYGNSYSWISNEAGSGWVQLEFPQTESFDRIEWARDREGRYSDRLATEYRIEASDDGVTFRTLASSRDRLPMSSPVSSESIYDFSQASPELAEQGRQWLAELKQAQQERDVLAVIPTVYAGLFSQPPPTHRLYRGDPLAPREEVNPDILEIFGTLQQTNETPEQQRRLRFADWLVSPDNPLTARVIINRLWQHHFGTGIVGTPNDFGKNGTPPSHPELLDWLAGELIRHGWSLKHTHRLILTSATWQQSSVPLEKPLAVDASSRMLWRFPPRRLEAEAIRDSILTVSGALDLTMGGPGFSGFQVEMENVRHFFPKTKYGPEDFRRMIYMTKVRQEQESVFGAFDCPDASQVISRRSRSTTPLQALNLMNSSFVLQQSELLAARLQQDAEDVGGQVQYAFEYAFGRPPEAAELTDSTAFIKEHGLPAFCRALLNANEFLFIP